MVFATLAAPIFSIRFLAKSQYINAAFWAGLTIWAVAGMRERYLVYKRSQADSR